MIILTCDWLQIVVPDTISACKRAKLTALGAALVTHGTDCEESEVAGRAMAERDPALEYVSPYNGSITQCRGYICKLFPPHLSIHRHATVSATLSTACRTWT